MAWMVIVGCEVGMVIIGLGIFLRSALQVFVIISLNQCHMCILLRKPVITMDILLTKSIKQTWKESSRVNIRNIKFLVKYPCFHSCSPEMFIQFFRWKTDSWRWIYHSQVKRRQPWVRSSAYILFTTCLRLLCLGLAAVCVLFRAGHKTTAPSRV